MGAVDEKSRRIITYLLRERHAGIRKLADLIDASSDMEVLIRIREIINPKARETLGAPLLTFERSKIDPLTGEKIVFCWWLREDMIDDAYRDERLDIFDEEKVVRIIASLPPHEKDIKVQMKDDFLIISGETYTREIPVFSPVEKEVRKTINHGILEVLLNKIE